MSKDKELLVKNQTFFSRIKNKIKSFLENLFFEEVEEIVEDEEKLKNEEDEKNEFIKGIKIEEDPERIRLFKLQDMIRYRQIDEKDISSEDVSKLRELYQEQIDNLRNLIDNHKNEIEIIKNRIEANQN
ncbi:MAG: hypothetical protein GX682_00845 [Clostridiaceae bacterium]|nr:hypothetical protein [Clostridiaceae bacterium]